MDDLGLMRLPPGEGSGDLEEARLQRTIERSVRLQGEVCTVKAEADATTATRRTRARAIILSLRFLSIALPQREILPRTSQPHNNFRHTITQTAALSLPIFLP